MNISQAINKLIFRFNNSIKNDDGSKRQNIKPFYPNQNDVDALKKIVKWVDTEKKRSIENNRIFAKLFIKSLEREIWRTSSYDMALEIVQRDLAKNLESHYKSFQIEMMMFNFDMACQMLGAPDDLNYFKGVSVEERREYTKKNLEFIKTNEIALKKEIISKHWSEENTRVRLNDLLSDMINLYGYRD